MAQRVLDTRRARTLRGPPAATAQMGTWVLLLPLLFAAEAQAQAQGTRVEGKGAERGAEAAGGLASRQGAGWGAGRGLARGRGAGWGAGGGGGRAGQRAGGWAGLGGLASGRGAGQGAGRGLAAPTLPPRRPVCSVDKTSLTVKENTNPGEPLLDIYVPQGQQVTLGPSSTLFAFRIQGNQLFLNVTPDYEVRTADPGWLCPWGRQGLPVGSTWALTLLPREGLSGALWVSVCPGGLLGPQAWLRAWSRGWAPQGVKLPGPDARWTQGGGHGPRASTCLAPSPQLGDGDSRRGQPVR